MLVHHHTWAGNLASIRERGLLTSKSRGKRKCVWVHPAGMTSWACSKLLRRRHGGIDQLVCLTLDVPRSWLLKHPSGFWWVDRDIPADRIVCIAGYQMYRLEESK